MTESSPAPTNRKRSWWPWIPLGLIALPLQPRQAPNWLAFRFTHSISKDAFIESHLINLSPQVAGDVVEVFVQEQDIVKKGQLLARIDPTTYRREVELAEAKVATSQAATRPKPQADLGAPDRGSVPNAASRFRRCALPSRTKTNTRPAMPWR